MTVQYVLIDDGHLYNCTKNESVPAPLSFLSIVNKKSLVCSCAGSFVVILLHSFAVLLITELVELTKCCKEQARTI